MQNWFDNISLIYHCLVKLLPEILLTPPGKKPKFCHHWTSSFISCKTTHFIFNYRKRNYFTQFSLIVKIPNVRKSTLLKKNNCSSKRSKIYKHHTLQFPGIQWNWHDFSEDIKGIWYVVTCCRQAPVLTVWEIVKIVLT